MKTTLRAHMSQQIGLTPQLLQSIRLLQVDAATLDAEIARALDENPMLERVDETTPTIDASLAGSAYGAAQMYDFRGAGHGDTDPLAAVAQPASTDRRVQVLDALSPNLDEADLAIAAWILDHVGDAGYLEVPHDELLAAGARAFETTTRHVESLRRRIVCGEIAGYAARDLAECLAAQLDDVAPDARGLALARRIVGSCLADFAQGDDASLAYRLGANEAEFGHAARLIRSLDPKPGELPGGDRSVAMIPEVVAVRGNGGWQVALNPHTAPRLRVNAGYENLLAGAGDTPGTQRLRNLAGEARWMARAVAMRCDTLLRTAQVLVERQVAFLERGEEGLVPLTLREVADAIGMHESTVSRITTGKYIATPRGTFELKAFFAVRLDGAAVSGAAVRAMVRRLIDGESPVAPLHDDAIVSLLARQGVSVARRTVAKYRDLMNIAPAKLRHGGFAPPARMVAC
jgi:RNA polymerase sigma-54 factor